MSKRYRAKFYSEHDLSSGFYLENAELFIKHFDYNKTYDINDVLEMCNLCKFINADITLKTWTDEEKEKYYANSSSYQKYIGFFASKINELNLKDIYELVDKDYKLDFWEMVEKYKVYERLSFSAIIVLDNENIIRLLLHFPHLSKYYSDEIRTVLLNWPYSGVLLLEKYHYDSDNIFLPDNLTPADKEKMLENYIYEKDVNYNFLHDIVNLKSNKNLAVSDIIRFKAKQRAEAVLKKHFENHQGFTETIEVGFKPFAEGDKIKPFKSFFDEEKCKATTIYNTNYLNENLDYNTILNNFIYVFGYVNDHMIISGISNEHHAGVLERKLIRGSKNDYFVSAEFRFQDKLHYLQMKGYYAFLKKKGIVLENVLEWFFKTYLLEEFGVKNYLIKLPKGNIPYCYKCILLCTSIDRVLKQYQLCVEDGKINVNRLELMSNSLLFENIPSLLNKKYVYGNGPKYNTIINTFFSDQSMLTYVPRIKQKYNCFYDLLKMEEVNISDYGTRLQDNIKNLVKQQLLDVDKVGMISFANLAQLKILKAIYDSYAIEYDWFPDKIKNDIDNLEKQGVVTFDDTLFSHEEVKFLDYYLNSREFGNSLKLRNKYIHGTYGNVVETHKNNYMVLLMLFTLIVIKINDDLCLNDNFKRRSKR